MKLLIIFVLLTGCGSGEMLDCIDGCATESPHEQIETLQNVIEELQALVLQQSMVLGEQAEKLTLQEELLTLTKEKLDTQEVITAEQAFTIQTLFQELEKEIVCTH